MIKRKYSTFGEAFNKWESLKKEGKGCILFPSKGGDAPFSHTTVRAEYTVIGITKEE